MVILLLLNILVVWCPPPLLLFSSNLLGLWLWSPEGSFDTFEELVVAWFWTSNLIPLNRLCSRHGSSVLLRFRPTILLSWSSPLDKSLEYMFNYFAGCSLENKFFASVHSFVLFASEKSCIKLMLSTCYSSEFWKARSLLLMSLLLHLAVPYLVTRSSIWATSS